VSTEKGTADRKLALAKLPARRFMNVVVIVFAGTMIMAMAITVGSMASLCVIAPANRCLAIRETVPATFIAWKIWFLPTLIISILVAAVAQIQGLVLWWNVLAAAIVAAGVRMAIEYVMSPIARSEIPFFVSVMAAVLFFGAQLSLLVGRSVGKLSV
jgi:hypothetical protein